MTSQDIDDFNQSPSNGHEEIAAFLTVSLVGLMSAFGTFMIGVFIPSLETPATILSYIILLVMAVLVILIGRRVMR